jgi:hypothetical protein
VSEDESPPGPASVPPDMTCTPLLSYRSGPANVDADAAWEIALAAITHGSWEIAHALAGRPINVNLDLGRHMYVTERASAAASEEHIQVCLARHRRGDWGLIAEDAEDLAVNNRSAAAGGMTLSAYPVRTDLPPISLLGRTAYGLAETLYIVTEGDGADRCTRILLADEY